MANRRFNTQVKKPGFLKGGQVKLDANKDGKISGKDFALLKKRKKEEKKGNSIMARPGLYANIHAKRKRGEKNAKKEKKRCKGCTKSKKTLKEQNKQRDHNG